MISEPRGESVPEVRAMPVEVGFPDYRLPHRFVTSFLLSVALLRRRSFSRDAALAVTGLNPSLEVLGADHIPRSGPCLVVCNHYWRPGFASWWLTLSVQDAVASQRAPGSNAEIRWVIADAWTYPPGTWKERLVTPLTSWAFRRVAHVYGFVSMPPMPPRPSEVAARAAAVLRTVRLARQAARNGGLIGLAPQGGDVVSWQEPPPKGAGEFIALLVGAGLPVLPVGIAEIGGRLRLSFGPIFFPEIPARNAGRDAVVTDQVMAAIGRQLTQPTSPLNQHHS